MVKTVLRSIIHRANPLGDFTKKIDQDDEVLTVTKLVDSRYRYTTLKIVSITEYYPMLEWIDKNTIGSVDVKIISQTAPSMEILIGFENADDALVFKIKFD